MFCITAGIFDFVNGIVHYRSKQIKLGKRLYEPVLY